MLAIIDLRWMPMRLARLSMVLAMVLAVTMPPAAASDHDGRRRDEVRRAVEAGEIRSLADILDGVRTKLPGEIAGVEVERKDGRWLYEFRVVDNQGRVFEVYVDARSGNIERIKEK